MKRILSLILSIVLILSTFAFGGTVSLADDITNDWVEVKPTDITPINIGFIKGFDWCLTSGGNGESNFMGLINRFNVGSNQVLSAECGMSWSNAYAFYSANGDTVITENSWQAPNFGTRYSWVKINPASNSVIVYVEIPDYKAAGADWGLGIGQILLAQSDDTSTPFEVELWDETDPEYYYLSINDDTWRTGYVGRGGTLENLPTGFKGYLRFDFENFNVRSNGTKTLDITKDYMIDKLNFTMNAVGPLDEQRVLLGAIFYAPDNDVNSNVFSYGGNYYQLTQNKLSDNMIVKPYSVYSDVDNSIGTNPYPAAVSTESYEAETPSLWSLDGVNIQSISGDTVVTEGYKDMFCTSWRKMAMQPGVDTFMLYIKLPEFEAENSFHLYFPMLTQSEAQSFVGSAWINPAGGRYKYLDINSTNWQAGTIGQDGELSNLGSGFEGYVKFDIKTFEGYEAATATINFNKVYYLHMIQIAYNYVGGEDNPLLIGTAYTVLEDCDTNYFVNSVTGESLCATVVKGDMNLSGELDAVDLAFARKMLLGTENPHISAWRRSDARDDDGKFNIRDLVYMKKRFSGAYFDDSFAIPAATAEYDERLNSNPDRGFRMEAYVNTATTGFPAGNVVNWMPLFKNAANSIKEGIWYNPKLVQVYFYLTEYKDSPVLPQSAIDNINLVFTTVAAEKQKAVVRFTYQGAIEEYADQASQEIMFKHMEQLAPVLEANKDVICTLEAGFLGAWGEWHGYTPNYYAEQNATSDEYLGVINTWAKTKDFDEVEIIKHILDMTPEGISVQLRTSVYRDLFLEAYPNQGYETRLGLKNDAFFGYKNTYSAWPYNSMTSEASISAHNASLLAPMGGEFFWGCQWPYDRVTAEEAILLYKYFHQSMFSVYHNSFEGMSSVANGSWFETDRVGDMVLWATEPVDTSWFDRNDIFYSDSWLKDANGNDVGRTMYEFVRDHLGYRLEAKELHIKGNNAADCNLDITLSLSNYGFAPAFNLSSEFVLIDEKNKIVERIPAGTPTDWHNAAADGSEFTLRTHNINASFKTPAIEGKYKLGFRIYNSADEAVALANSIEFINGCNILYEFEF